MPCHAFRERLPACFLAKKQDYVHGGAYHCHAGSSAVAGAVMSCDVVINARRMRGDVEKLKHPGATRGWRRGRRRAGSSGS